MTRIQRADQRYPGGDPAAGIETRHALSFGSYYDPDNLRFGALLAVNEERLAPGAGFDEHPHSHTEIVTWVVEGELTHHDTAGHTTVVRPGDLQRLSSAGGVRHVERNDADVPLVFVQMWLAPVEPGGEPSYEVVRGGDGSWSYDLAGADARLHVHRPAADERIAVPDADFAYVHVVRGTVRLDGFDGLGGPDGLGGLDGEELGAGDAARITDAERGTLVATTDAEVLIWAMRDWRKGLG
ncbi:pirin family protein [Streptomyces sp. NBC_00094]|uniref:pirin family protein n=1 Tax=Streptomyces sp. NBC_00094 TaxID=2903620 RepID=UPI002250B11C|nr:pirin family protein [Streptomyces sp. NBC_00094]MCX5390472.1 pirin family protein [Streptomyces sp. NBC_00094]